MIGDYRILRQIGSGGMGEVYLAEDTRLRRKIALKVLPQNADEDEELLRRFEQEAFAASGLNHPNIITIFEYGSDNGTPYLASEFVDGETLRERVRRDRPTISEILDIAIQTGEALSAAHEAGIVHRDIKPENIMIRPDNLVKVLDFGLAKLIEKSAEPVNDQAETVVGGITEPGMILGTFAYMSPEQSRGKETDARSDIWSLGCVLYEMICGKAPFAGDSAADCLVAIIQKDHGQISLISEGVPAQLDEIVDKCLAKNREERYPTIKDLLADLRRLKKRLDFEVEKERSESGYDIDDIGFVSGKIGTSGAQTKSVSSAEYIVTEIKRNKRYVFGVAAVLVICALGAGAFYLYKYLSYVPPPPPRIGRFLSPEKLKFTPLVASGKISAAAISPDGKYAAYVVSNAKKVSIRLQQIASKRDVQLIAPRENARFRNLSFTPDGNYVYYGDPGPDGDTIYKVSSVGGMAKKIVNQVSSGAAVSPDGKKIAFIRADQTKATRLLQVADTDGSNPRKILQLSNTVFQGNFAPAWSPDGGSVAHVIHSEGTRQSNLWAISIADGSRRELSERDWLNVNGIVWLPDGDLVVSGNERSAGQVTPEQLWSITPGSQPRRITNPQNGYSGLSATAVGDTLATTRSNELFDLWTVDIDTAKADEVMPASEIKGGISVASNGRFVFESTVEGNSDIRIMRPDGLDSSQLSLGQDTNSDPSMSSDGRYIIFVSDRVKPDEHVFLMNADGTDRIQLTDGEQRQWSPRFSPDGQWVYYVETTPEYGLLNICKMPVDGGNKIVIARNPSGLSTRIDISPRDGMVAYEQKDDLKAERRIVAITADGAPVTTLVLPATASSGAFHWTHDGRAIAFVDSRDNGANIWTIAIDGKSAAKPLTNFPDESIRDFAWSPDGKQLYVIRGTTVVDAWLISETK